MELLDHQKVDCFFYGNQSNFKEVHNWLDSTHYRYSHNPYYAWLDTHHKEALHKQYGQYTLKYNIGYLHVLVDWLSHFQIAEVPQDRQEVEILLKSLDIIKGGE